MMRKYYIIFSLFTFALILFPDISHSQSFKWNIDFEVKFDNLEYSKMSTYVPSGTIFYTSITPFGGLMWDKNHSVNIGMDITRSFGDPQMEMSYVPFIFYLYERNNVKFHAGSFPRANVEGYYSQAFFSDSTMINDLDLEGIMFQYSGDRGYLEFVFDWPSMPTEDEREMFMFFGSGRLNLNNFYGGYSFNVFHFAGSETVRGVVDNILVNPFVGFNKDDLGFLDYFDLKVGWLQSFQRDRIHNKEYLTPGGALIEFNIEKYRIGLLNSLYIGKDIMPLYDVNDAAGVPYSNTLYLGNRFFGTKYGIYNMVELYWNPIINDFMDLKFSGRVHYDGKSVGCQQVVVLSISLFPSKKR